MPYIKIITEDEQLNRIQQHIENAIRNLEIRQEEIKKILLTLTDKKVSESSSLE